MRFTTSGKGFGLEVELPVASHERIGIVGPNGAGKSTLLAQWLRLNASDSAHPATVLLQQRSLCFPHLTVIENVAFPMRSRGQSRTQARTAARELLASVKLDDLAERYPSALSGGQRQQVALLRALATGASTVLLDEPLAGLDVRAAHEYRELLGSLGNRIQQLVLVSHDPRDLLRLVDRIIVLDGGKLVADLPIQDLFSNPPDEFTAVLVGNKLRE